MHVFDNWTVHIFKIHRHTHHKFCYKYLRKLSIKLKRAKMVTQSTFNLVKNLFSVTQIAQLQSLTNNLFRQQTPYPNCLIHSTHQTSNIFTNWLLLIISLLVEYIKNLLVEGLHRINWKETNQKTTRNAAQQHFLRPCIYNNSVETEHMMTGMTWWDARLSYIPSGCSMTWPPYAL